MSEHLLPGEEIVAEVRRHWTSWVRPRLLPGLLLPLLAGAIVGAPLPSPLGALTRMEMAAAVLGFALVWLYAMYLHWRAETLTLTDRRVVLSSGVFSRFTRSIRLDRVQDVSLVQPMLGRLFHFGSVLLESAGQDGVEAFNHIPHPAGFHGLLLEQLDRVSARP